MSDCLSSFPPYPKGPGSELPPARSDWGAVLWVGFILTAGTGLVTLLRWLAPGLVVFAFFPGALPVLAGIVAMWGFVLLLGFIYAWVRSERYDR
jgi:hypothetical protein